MLAAEMICIKAKVQRKETATVVCVIRREWDWSEKSYRRYRVYINKNLKNEEIFILGKLFFASHKIFYFTSRLFHFCRTNVLFFSIKDFFFSRSKILALIAGRNCQRKRKKNKIKRKKDFANITKLW